MTITLNELTEGWPRGQRDALRKWLDYGKRFDDVYFGQIAIAADARCCVRTVQSALKRAIAEGKIEVEKRPGELGRWAHNAYRLAGDAALYVAEGKARATARATAAAERARRFAHKLARELADNRIAEAVRRQLDAYKAEVSRRKSKRKEKGVACEPHANIAGNPSLSTKVLKETTVEARRAPEPLRPTWFQDQWSRRSGALASAGGAPGRSGAVEPFSVDA